jgi:hypothetical protein
MTNRAAEVFRPVIEGSICCRALAGAARAMRRTHKRIIVGLGGGWSEDDASRESRALDALTADSRIIGGVSSLVMALPLAWKDTGIKRSLDAVIQVDLLERIKLLGILVITALTTHAVLLALLGLSLHEIGWGLRAGWLGVGLFALGRPEPLAAAWKSRSEGREKGHRS